MATTVLAIYQAIDPEHPLLSATLREAFAIHDGDTIMGYSIIRASERKQTGSTSYGPSANAELIRRKADDSVSGYYKSAIEPDGDKWTLNIYERPRVEAIHTSTYAQADDALIAGREMLERMAKAPYQGTPKGWESVEA